MDNEQLTKVCEIQLKYNPEIKASDRPQIQNSDAAVEILRRVWDPDSIRIQESFKVILLNNSNRVLGVLNLSNGGMAGTTVDNRIMFATALKAQATSLIVAHNHPSGNVEPSGSDKNMTDMIIDAGKLLSIQVLDHIIITNESHFSFADANML